MSGQALNEEEPPMDYSKGDRPRNGNQLWRPSVLIAIGVCLVFVAILYYPPEVFRADSPGEEWRDDIRDVRQEIDDLTKVVEGLKQEPVQPEWLPIDPFPVPPPPPEPDSVDPLSELAEDVRALKEDQARRDAEQARKDAVIAELKAALAEMNGHDAVPPPQDPQPPAPCPLADRVAQIELAIAKLNVWGKEATQYINGHTKSIVTVARAKELETNPYEDLGSPTALMPRYHSPATTMPIPRCPEDGCLATEAERARMLVPATSPRRK